MARADGLRLRRAVSRGDFLRADDRRDEVDFAESSSAELSARLAVLRDEDFFEADFLAVDLLDAELAGAALAGLASSAEAAGFFLRFAELAAGFFALESGESCAARAENGAKASHAARRAARRRAETEVGGGTDLISQLYDALPERRASGTSGITRDNGTWTRGADLLSLVE